MAYFLLMYGFLVGTFLKIPLTIVNSLSLISWQIFLRLLSCYNIDSTRLLIFLQVFNTTGLCMIIVAISLIVSIITTLIPICIIKLSIIIFVIIIIIICRVKLIFISPIIIVSIIIISIVLIVSIIIILILISCIVILIISIVCIIIICIVISKILSISYFLRPDISCPCP